MIVARVRKRPERVARALGERRDDGAGGRQQSMVMGS